MARTSNLANVATVTRASKAWDPLWDFTSGGTVGTLTEYASGVARYGANGLLVEETSTNHIRNPRAETLTTGFLNAGGVLPLHWGNSGQSAAINVVGSGTENGWRYVDIQVTGLTAGFYIFFDENNRPDPTGLGATGSVGIKIVGGSTANLTSLLHSVRELNSGSTVAEHYTDILGSIDTSHKRFHNTVLSASLGVSNQARHELFFGWSSGATDLTLRFYVPQLETKAYPTSPILPVVASPAASTRAADVITVANGAWVNAGTGDHTIYAELIPNNTRQAATPDEIAIWNGSSFDNMLVLRHGLSPGADGLVRAGGAAVFDATGAAVTTGTAVRHAIAYSANDMAYSRNGETQETDTSGTLTTFTPLLAIGRVVSSFYVKDVRYWPRRLSNAELEALVGN